MKLLLTSSGLRNKSIENALRHLQGKPFGKMNLAFIPTAANVEEGDKWWLIEDLANCKKLGFASVDIVDISALPKSMWQKRLEAAGILLFGGGNTFHLMYWLKKSGLEKLLPLLLKTRVYVGISAGSMVTGKNLSLSQSQKLYYEDLSSEYKDETGLGFVNFHVRPHLNNPSFPKVKVKYLEKLATKIPEPIYAIDDETALKVVDGKVEIVSEGKHAEFNLKSLI